MHTRVLFLGSTGTDKMTAVKKCVRHLAQYGHKSDVRPVDFEREYLFSRSGSTIQSFLAKPALEQAEIWKHGWDNFVKTLSNGIVLLALHGTIVRDDFGVRIAMDTGAVVRDFRPSLVVTLIDDVYTCWWRTEQRASGELSRGRPTFEQLLMARRVEAILGDEVIRQLRAADQDARHVMLSIQHPVTALTHLVLSENAKVVYLSFPITAPVELSESKVAKMRDQGQRVRSAINEFHTLALDFQQRYTELVVVSPLTIEEIPFADAALKNAKKNEFQFDVRKHRWPISDLWGSAEILSGSCPSSIPIRPASSAALVEGLLRTDVGWRDYRLVEQSYAVACFSPVVPRVDGDWRLSRGVEAELKKAVRANVPVYVFQEPRFDPKKAWLKRLPSPGAMGHDPDRFSMENKSSTEELFESILRRS